MLVKPGIAAAALAVVAVTLSAVDFRGLYNEMYPINGLKRDVLGICHAARPTFIRAVRIDRIDCYDSMPDAIDLAIGWVRTSDRLAAMRPPSAIDLAERFLISAAAPGGAGFLDQPHFTGYLAAPTAPQPCRPPALALAGSSGPKLDDTDGALARRLAKGDDAALAALGLPTRTTGRDSALPVLPLDGGATAASSASGDGLVSRAAASGCSHA